MSAMQSVDPYHFDLDPDPGKSGSGSDSGSGPDLIEENSNSFLHFFKIKNITQNYDCFDIY